MSDFGSFGGADEEYAAVRKHSAEVVCSPDLVRAAIIPLTICE